MARVSCHSGRPRTVMFMGTEGPSASKSIKPCTFTTAVVPDTYSISIRSDRLVLNTNICVALSCTVTQRKAQPLVVLYKRVQQASISRGRGGRQTLAFLQDTLLPSVCDCNATFVRMADGYT